MTLQELAKLIESTSDESFSLTLNSDKVRFTCPTSKLMCKVEDISEDFAFECAMALEPEIDHDQFRERWDSYMWMDMEMGEPGYDYDCVIIGDWWLRENEELTDVTTTFKFQVDLKRLYGDKSERVLIDWSENWQSCQSCYKAYRTTQDCYTWKSKMDHMEEWDSYVCESCIREDKAELEYLKQFHNDATKATKFDWDLEELGYVKYNGTYQNGFHEHMTDDPRKIFKFLQEKLAFPTILFRIGHVSQFYIEFETWVPKHTVALWNMKDEPSHGVGLIPASERYIKVVRDECVNFQTIEEWCEDMDLWSDEGGDFYAVLMTLEEGESVSVDEDEDIVMFTRVTSECYNKHTA